MFRGKEVFVSSKAFLKQLQDVIRHSRTSATSGEENNDEFQINVPDEQTFLVRSLLNYDTPHYFAKFSIAGCPPGLEILDKYEHLVINRRLQNANNLDPDQKGLAYSQFDVKNSRGMHLYLALESVEQKTLRWIRDARFFEVSFFDFHCRKVFTVKRKKTLPYFFAQYLCLLCTYGFKGCGNAVEILLSDGSRLGTVYQRLSFSSVELKIYDKDGKLIMYVEGVVGDGILDVTMPDDDEPLAMIETLMTPAETFDFYRVNVPRNSCPYGITFFKNFVSPEEKALILGAVILLDFIVLNPITDYPRFAELIPDDYEASRRPRVRTLRAGSKELLIMTESKKYYREKKHNEKVQCCLWCTEIVCILCRLGFKRNAVRFIFLVVGIIILIIVYFMFLF